MRFRERYIIHWLCLIALRVIFHDVPSPASFYLFLTFFKQPTQSLQQIINQAFTSGLQSDASSLHSINQAVKTTLQMLDFGKIRVAEKNNGSWQVNQWVKQAILLSFRFSMYFVPNNISNNKK